jgi:hypothetical protein
MRQKPKQSNGITISYATPHAEAELLRQLVTENELLVSHDLDVARARKSSVPPVEFTTERSGVVDTEYTIVLDRSLRKRAS